jgi:hypothetical protein
VSKNTQIRNRIIILFIIFLGLFLVWQLVLWLMNGGEPVNQASGEKMPIHIMKVSPIDGELATSPRGYCVDFNFRAGNGMGNAPEKSIHYFFDGIDVTSQTDGLVTLNIPPSAGSICYKPGIQLSEGWHSAKVSYFDVKGKSFQYLWRFQVEKK